MSNKLSLVRLALVGASALLLLAACGDDGSTPIYNPFDAGNGGVPDASVSGPDGSGPGTDVTVDPGQDVVTSVDTPAGEDIPVTRPDTTVVPDTNGGGPDVPVVTEDLQVVSAFSADGRTITVRFNRDVDPATGGDLDNFTLLEGATPMDVLTGAVPDGAFVRLMIRGGTQFDTSYTYKVRVANVEAIDGKPLDVAYNQAIVRRSVYLSIVWHQHQPLYLDVLKDELQGPWVRKHATKDYYDMASAIEPYPDVHMTINLTIVMLDQLEEYYLNRLGPYVDVENNTVDEAAFDRDGMWGKTDPWIDLLLQDTPTPETLTEKQKGLLYADPWACVSTNEAVLRLFPEYEEVRYKNPAELTRDDFLMLKLMFELAWIDPEFLNGPVTMPDGTVVDLTDIIEKGGDGKYRLKVAPSEELANRLVAEQYKIMANVIGIHQKLRYSPSEFTGQIEIATTPYYHPILPLVYDTSLASMASGDMPLPDPGYSFPEDARAQVLRAVGYYERLFGEKPHGMWPGEGSVAEDVIPIFVANGIDLTWIATGQEVLQCSTGSGPHYYPYRVDADTVAGSGDSTDDEMLIVFRDPILSDKMGFDFQAYQPQDAVNEFIHDVLAQAPKFGADDRMVTVILDGENAWESYRHDHDAKNFFRILYSTLDKASRDGEIITITPTEYVTGNPKRGIPAHPIHDQRELEPLWAGSWIAWEKNDADPCANFEVWIGEPEENTGWEYLVQARTDLMLSGLPRPNPLHDEPNPDDDLTFWHTWKAFDEIYAAEGSDWFWWYGGDQTTPANDDSPFDVGYRAHLDGMYYHMNAALELLGEPTFAAPDFAPIIQESAVVPDGPFTVTPTIDGALVPGKNEWLQEGGSISDRDSGAMHNPNDDLTELYYGYTETDFYLALISPEVYNDHLGEPYNISVYLSQKHVLDAAEGTASEEPANTHTDGGYALDFKDSGATWKLTFDFSGAQMQTVLYKADGSGGWTQTANNIEVGGPVEGGRVLELRIPLSDLALSWGDPLEFMAAVMEEGREIDLAPNENFGSYQIFEDATALVYVTFEVDASGNEVNLETFTDLCVLPQDGGIVYIVGNHQSLGLEGDDWIPNKIGMVDNGSGPDANANDNVWSMRTQLSRGFGVRWKYSIGQPQHEAQWGCTEEFPITERGWLIPENPNLARVTISDVFANKPTGGLDGNPGSMTVITCFDRDGNVIDPCN